MILIIHLMATMSEMFHCMVMKILFHPIVFVDSISRLVMIAFFYKLFQRNFSTVTSYKPGMSISIRRGTCGVEKAKITTPNTEMWVNLPPMVCFRLFAAKRLSLGFHAKPNFHFRT
jgi:hypothetical protein